MLMHIQNATEKILSKSHIFSPNQTGLKGHLAVLLKLYDLSDEQSGIGKPAL
jgi:hypothetical protein